MCHLTERTTGRRPPRQDRSVWEHGPARSSWLAWRVLALVLALVSVQGSAACSKPEDLETPFGSWDLPEDLDVRQVQLSALGLTGPVDRIDWVQSRLERLSLRGTQVPTLASLPDGLRVLDLCNSPVEHLEELPSGLRYLDARLTALEEVGTLPEELTFLALGGQDLLRVGKLPDSLEHLELVEAPNLEALHLPGSALRTLALTGVGEEAIRALPSGLETLALMATSIQTIEDLPTTVERLILRRNKALRSISWPTTLSDLWVDELAQSSLGPLPETLRSLKLQRSPVGSPKVWPVPLRRLELYWVNMSWGDPPPLLRDLVVYDSPLPPVLPGNLASLKVGGRSGISDEELARAVPGIVSLGNSLLELSLDRFPEGLDLSELPALRTLELNVFGDLEGLSLPSTLEELAVHGSISLLPELPPSLRRLDLTDSMNLSALPDLASHRRLEELEVRNTGLSRLPELPISLRKLDISGTAIRDLEGLPQGLESLTLHLGQVNRLGELPEQLRELTFVPADGYSPCPDLLIEIPLPK